MMAAAAPWYTSPVQKAQVVSLVSALIALSPKIGHFLGIKTPADVQLWVESLFGFFTIVAPIVGTIMRARSPLQPLTLTQKAADEHPATEADAAQAKVNEQNAHTAALVIAAQRRKASQPTPPSIDPTKPWGK
jgi:uncharacterized membrane protein